jgi:hypothetical protein
MPFVGEVLTRLRQSVGNEAAVLGFVGAPWTLAAYVVEGKSSKNYAVIKAMAFREPAAAAPAARPLRRLDRRLPALPDRLRRPGGADVRFLGRPAQPDRLRHLRRALSEEGGRTW